MRIWFPPTGDCECYENAGHRGDRLPGKPRGEATCRARRASARPGASSERYASHRWIGGGTFHRRLAGHGFSRTRYGGRHARDARHSALERSRVPQVADETFRLQSIDGSRIARWTHQDAHLLAAPGKLPRHVASQEAGRPGDQRFHNTRSLPSEETRSAFCGGGGISVPPPVCPLVGPAPALLPGCPPIRPENCHFNIFQVSPNWRLAPSTGVVSNPTCIMQSAHRGSLPGPYFSQGVESTNSR